MKRKKEVETLTLPGMEKRSMPPGRIEKDPGDWKETPLFKATLRAEIDKNQGNLFDKGGETS